jgi:hypothetical protein
LVVDALATNTLTPACDTVVVVDEGEGAVVVGTPVEGRWKAGTVPAPGPPPMRRISTPSTTAVTITAIARPSTM